VLIESHVDGSEIMTGNDECPLYWRSHRRRLPRNAHWALHAAGASMLGLFAIERPNLNLMLDVSFTPMGQCTNRIDGTPPVFDLGPADLRRLLPALVTADCLPGGSLALAIEAWHSSAVAAPCSLP